LCSGLLELFDWLRCAVALARRPRDGFVDGASQRPVTLLEAVTTHGQLYPRFVGFLSEAEQPTRSPEDTEALRVATESLWQRLHTLLLERQAHCQSQPSSEAPVAAGETVSAAAVPAAALEAGP